MGAEHFGTSVAISGTTAIVGADHDYDGGLLSSGSAYIFDTVTGQELFKLNSSDIAEFDKFGYSVAISGTTGIVAAIGDSDAGFGSGSVYIFNTTTGQELSKITASDAASGAAFGTSVAISETTLIVGAFGNNDWGSDSGAAYIFNTTNGQQFFKFTASDANANDRFGWSVAIFGTTAVVGAPLNDDDGNASGSVYIFDTVTGQELFKLTASDAAAGDRFGSSVAIYGTTAIVGAYGNNDGGNDSGSAYIFNTTSGKELFKLTVPDAVADTKFGSSVAVSGTTAIIGAIGDSGVFANSGSAYIFDTATGLELYKLAASDPVYSQSFGFSVAISGSTAFVGAKGDNDAGNGAGSAYVFNDIFDSTSCPADLNEDDSLNFLDVSAFLAAFKAQDPLADFEPDGSYNFLDVSAFLAAYAAGCP